MVLLPKSSAARVMLVAFNLVWPAEPNACSPLAARDRVVADDPALADPGLGRPCHTALAPRRHVLPIESSAAYSDNLTGDVDTIALPPAAT